MSVAMTFTKFNERFGGRFGMFLAAVMLVGCGTSEDSNNNPSDGHSTDSADTETVMDTGVDTDGNGDTDSNADTADDSDNDSETSAHELMTQCDGGYMDLASGLCRQDPPHETPLEWMDGPAFEFLTAAPTYCDDLALGGYSDWYLPNIEELRTLVRGCPVTAPGGDCNTQEGVNPMYWGDNWMVDCQGCSGGEGPGTNGCYRDAAFNDSCAAVYFYSSSGYGPDPGMDWEIQFV